MLKMPLAEWAATFFFCFYDDYVGMRVAHELGKASGIYFNGVFQLDVNYNGVWSGAIR